MFTRPGRKNLRCLNRTALVCLLTFAACSRAPAPVESRDRESEARTAATQLKTTLVKELTTALQRGGPLDALDVCSERAQALTAAAATPSVRVGRTSHRLRNPKNRAPAWLQPRVDALARGEKVEAGSLVVDGGRLAYYEPLVTQPLCTTCHGTDLPEELRTAIARRYPEDAAVGFAPGDIRGLVWVEVSP